MFLFGRGVRLVLPAGGPGEAEEDHRDEEADDRCPAKAVGVSTQVGGPPVGVECVAALYGPCAADNLSDLSCTAISLDDLRHERSGECLEKPRKRSHQAGEKATEPAAERHEAGKKRNDREEERNYVESKHESREVVEVIIPSPCQQCAGAIIFITVYPRNCGGTPVVVPKFWSGWKGRAA